MFASVRVHARNCSTCATSPRDLAQERPCLQKCKRMRSSSRSLHMCRASHKAVLSAPKSVLMLAVQTCRVQQKLCTQSRDVQCAHAAEAMHTIQRLTVLQKTVHPAEMYSAPRMVVQAGLVVCMQTDSAVNQIYSACTGVVRCTQTYGYAVLRRGYTT